MIEELNIYINESVQKAFLNNFVMTRDNITKIIHCHKYSEIHIIFGGNATLRVENGLYDFSSGDICIIPAGVYHCFKNSTAKKHFAFQITKNSFEFMKKRISESILYELDRTSSENVENSAGLSALLSFICSEFFPYRAILKMNDTACLIYEFISQNYNRDVKLSDLAGKIHFSEKQTARLVKKFTGMTFREYLMTHRLTVAEYLTENSNMTEAEIAEYVGYSTYSGFWKAKNKLKAK